MIGRPFSYTVAELESDAPLYVFPFQEEAFKPVFTVQRANTGELVEESELIEYGRFFVVDQNGNGYPSSDCFDFKDSNSQIY